MSYLGLVLDFPTGSRLTHIGIQSVVREATESEGRLFTHLVRLSDGEDAQTVSSAVSVFLPTAFIDIAGYDPDGGAWFVAFQYGPPGVDPEAAERGADGALHRALDLTRTLSHRITTRSLDAEDLRDAYMEKGAVPIDDWTLSELLTGLMLDLANVDLGAVVRAANDTTLDGEARRGHRRRCLDDALHHWAATYEGPESTES